MTTQQSQKPTDPAPLDLKAIRAGCAMERLGWPRFIAHARTDIPALLDALETAQARLDAVKALCDEAEKPHRKIQGNFGYVDSYQVRRALDGDTDG